MTITDQLEGLLIKDGPDTKDQRIIADAVAELRERDLWADFTPGYVEHPCLPPVWPRLALAFILGIAATLAAGGGWA